jgi:hypothetical protein|tara:strand:+ start:1912 stop:2922 length:1011 start_codon:yes stop_codon:yes gene_type:complete
MNNKNNKSFEEMYKIQEKFTKEFFLKKMGYDVSTIKEDYERKIFWTKDYVLSLIKEATEILDEVDWKFHATKDTVDIEDNLLEEGVDVLKYLLGLLILNGFSADEIYNKFIDKSKVVEAKFEQEELIEKLKSERGHKIVFVDIDGVLATWPETYIQFVNNKLGTNYETFFEVENSLEKKLAYSIKNDYRLSGVKSNMGMLENAAELLDSLKNSGYYIVLLTARLYKKIFRIYSDTLEWLNKNNLYFDAIIWKEEKEKYIIEHFNSNNVMFCIDDNINNVNKLYEKGFDVFLINNELMFESYDKMIEANSKILNKNIKTFNTLSDLISFLKTKNITE